MILCQPTGRVDAPPVVVAVRYGLLSIEQSDALFAVSKGQPYRGADGGNAQGGRTRSLNSLFRKNLITFEGGHKLVITDQGRALMMQRREIHA